MVVFIMTIFFCLTIEIHVIETMEMCKMVVSYQHFREEIEINFMNLLFF